MSATVLRPLAPPGAATTATLRPPGARKPPSAAASNRRLVSFGTPQHQGSVPPAPPSASMLYSNGHDDALPRGTQSDSAVNEHIFGHDQRPEAEPQYRPGTAEEQAEIASLQADLIDHQYGTVSESPMVGIEEPAQPPKKNELFDSIVSAPAQPAHPPMPRRSTTESLVTTDSRRYSSKRSESDDELRVSGPVRRGRTPPPSEFGNFLSTRSRGGMTARRVRTVTTNIALPYNAAILSNPMLQQVYEPEDMRFARLEFLVEQRHKVHVLWFNTDAIENLRQLKASMQKRRRRDQMVVGEERDTYEEEISLRAISGEADEGDHSSDDSPTGSMVKRFSKAQLFNSTDSINGTAADGRPTRSMSSSTIMAPVAASGVSKTSSSPNVAARPLMSRSAGELPMGPEIDMQGSAADPIVPEAFVRGLYKLRAELEVMLVHPHSTRTGALYTPSSPPRRTLYVQSQRGSGVYTLVKSMCHSRKFNFMRVHMASDLTFSDEMFTHLIDYARLIQPCVVLFDRCDFWFRPDSYPMRGEKFVISHCGYPTIGDDEVFFVFSGDTPLPSTHPGFREFISYRHIVESEIDERARSACFQSFFETWINQMRHCGSESTPSNIDQVIAGYLPQLKIACDEMAEKWSTFTPGMIKVFCDRVIESARTRATNEAIPLPDQPIYIHAAFPIEDDFTFVESLIETTTPGRIVWKTY